MLLVIDVGNTNITLGVFRGEEILGTFRMKSKQPRTSDEYGITLQELVERHGIPSSEIHHVIIASVVPDIMHSLGSAIIKYFHIKPVVVSAGIRTGIRIVTENPRQVGPDRIVDAVGAYTLHGGPVIVVDFGTSSDRTAPLRQGLSHLAFGPQPRRCGAKPTCCRPLRSKSHRPFWQKRLSPACRAAFCMARWARPSISSGA